jgi:hypothetical protein
MLRRIREFERRYLHGKQSLPWGDDQRAKPRRFDIGMFLFTVAMFAMVLTIAVMALVVLLYFLAAVGTAARVILFEPGRVAQSIGREASDTWRATVRNYRLILYIIGGFLALHAVSWLWERMQERIKARRE